MKSIEFEIVNQVAWVNINRPQVLNAIDFQTAKLLKEVLLEINESEALVIVLKGSAKSFSAGSDVKELSSKTPEEATAIEEYLSSVYSLLENNKQITVVAYRGYCLGGGLLMGTYSDFRVVSTKAQLACTEVSLGWVSPWGISKLIEKVGLSKANRLLLAGEKWDGPMAYENGLAEYCFPEETFESDLTIWAEKLAAQPKLAVFETKAIMRGCSNINHLHWDKMAANSFKKCLDSVEAKTTMKKFMKV